MNSVLIVDDISDQLPIFTLYNTTNVPKSKNLLILIEQSSTCCVKLCESLDNSSWEEFVNVKMLTCFMLIL